MLHKFYTEFHIQFIGFDHEMFFLDSSNGHFKVSSSKLLFPITTALASYWCFIKDVAAF